MTDKPSDEKPLGNVATLRAKVSELEQELKDWGEFFECTNDLLCVASMDGFFLRLNPQWEKVLGYTRDELYSVPFLDFVHPEDRDLTDNELKRLLHGKTVQNFNNRFLCKDGSIRWLSWNSVPSPSHKYIYAVARDITEYMQLVEEITRERDQLDFLVVKRNAELVAANEKLKKRIDESLKIEKELYTSRQMLYLVLDNVPQCIFWKDSEGTYLGCNKNFAKTVGLNSPEEIKGKTVYDLPVTRDEADNFIAWDKKVMTQNQPEFNITEKAHLPDGTEHWINTNIIPLHDETNNVIGVLGTFTDITEHVKTEAKRRKMEEQIQQAQKLESLGLLAGGIAHDFNNLLMGIVGNASLILLDMPPNLPWRESLEQIERSAHRASELTRQLLAYSGKGKFVIESVDLNHLIENMLELLKVSISKSITLTLHLNNQLPAIDADASQIRQVVMNLISNASEAIDDKPGNILINTGSMECDAAYLKDTFLDDELEAGTYVYLEVSDNGCGIKNEAQKQIFDPFYTTKFTGRGLGLAAVLGIVRGHHGAMKVYSEEGKGTTFKCIFPASEQITASTLEETRSAQSPLSGSGTILVVDDEPMVRTVAKQMLERYGYKVIEAADGDEAIDLFKADPHAIDLVLLDMTMPRKSGEQTFRELRQIKKEIKVILSSGYNEQEVIQYFSGKGLAGFLQKPYQLNTLVSTIRELMEVQ